MDYRFVEGIITFLDDSGYKNSFDLISLAGCGMNIPHALFRGDKSHLIQNIIASHKLHGTEEIIFFNHRDCGAYKMKGMLPELVGTRKELEIHKKDLLKDRQTLVNLIGDDIKIKAYLVGANDYEDPTEMRYDVIY